MSADLVERLRASATQARAIDRAELLREAADEIERRTLTNAEQEALIVASIELQALTMNETNHSDSLRGLLARLQGS